MHKDERLLVVGGAGRNVGKTEFVCRLIAKFATNRDIYGLKVSTIFPDEALFHGTHADDEPVHQLFEETRRELAKDTSRMLRAGAKKVYYLRSDDSGIKESFEYFRNLVPENAIIICESNSLGQVVIPGLKIMVRSTNGQVKPRAIAQLKEADIVVVSDGSSGFPELDSIQLADNNTWQVNSPNGT